MKSFEIVLDGGSIGGVQLESRPHDGRDMIHLEELSVIVQIPQFVRHHLPMAEQVVQHARCAVNIHAVRDIRGFQMGEGIDLWGEVPDSATPVKIVRRMGSGKTEIGDPDAPRTTA